MEQVANGSVSPEEATAMLAETQTINLKEGSIHTSSALPPYSTGVRRSRSLILSGAIRFPVGRRVAVKGGKNAGMLGIASPTSRSRWQLRMHCFIFGRLWDED